MSDDNDVFAVRGLGTSADGTGRCPLDTEALRLLYRKVIQIRAFEDKARELFMQGLLMGTTHLSNGHEGVSVGAISALAEDDLVFATYRGHHHTLSVGVDPYVMFAEMLGRSTGNCGGMGGSTHAATSVAHGLMGTSLIIGAGIPMAVGAAMGMKLRNEPRVVLCLFGDGATNAGAFHEALNMASLWKVPVVFLIENNQYAEYSPYRVGTSVPDLAIRALSYAMPGRTVDGQDAVAVHEAIAEAVDRARTASTPSLIEAKTYRFQGHSRTDPAKYRTLAELERWKLSDPIDVLAARLRAVGGLTPEEEKGWEADVRDSLDEAAERAAQDPYPTVEEAWQHVFA